MDGLSFDQPVYIFLKYTKFNKTGSEAELTTIEKVKARTLAPSTELKPNEVVDVLNFMFEWVVMDMAGIYKKTIRNKDTNGRKDATGATNATGATGPEGLYKIVSNAV